MKLSRRALLVLSLLLVLTLGQAALAKEVINFWKPAWDDSWDNVFQKYCDEWAALNPEYEVKMSRIPVYGDDLVQSYLQKLLVAFTGGVGPDLFMLATPYATPFVEAGILADLTDAVSQEYLDDVPPGVRAGWTVGGELFALQQSTDPIALFIRPDLNREAGVEAPKNWDDLVTNAKKLQAEKRWGFASMIHTPDPHSLMYINSFVWQGGADFLDDYALPNVATADTPEMAAAIQFMSDLYNTHGVAGKGVNVYSEKTFENDQAAMWMVGPWGLSTTLDIAPNMEFDTIVLPSGPAGGATVIGGWAGVASNRSKNLEASKSLLAYMLSVPEHIDEIAEVIGVLPGLRSVAAAIDFEGNGRYKKAFIDELEWPNAKLEMMTDPAVSKIIYEVVQRSVFEGLSGADAAAELNMQLQSWIDMR